MCNVSRPMTKSEKNTLFCSLKYHHISFQMGLQSSNYPIMTLMLNSIMNSRGASILQASSDIVRCCQFVTSHDSKASSITFGLFHIVN